MNQMLDSHNTNSRNNRVTHINSLDNSLDSSFNRSLDNSCNDLLVHSADDLIKRYIEIRSRSERICEPLQIEDYVVQPTPEVSPPKWHLAHTTWFFEEIILKQFDKSYCTYDQGFALLFNSYYKAAGEHWLQAERGHLSRPTVAEVLSYRKSVDDHIIELLKKPDGLDLKALFSLLEIGFHHEQQHQELLLMDIKTILATNPFRPAYSKLVKPSFSAPPRTWNKFQEGLYEIGPVQSGFSYDCENPRHKIYLYPFRISETLVSNAEFLEFIEDDGYKRPEFWLSKGLYWVEQNSVECPLYWHKENNNWHEYTLYGDAQLDPFATVTHINYFEADAFASWKGLRLPTEAEMEVFLGSKSFCQNPGLLHPQDTSQAADAAWCWTRSQFSPYPGYKKFEGMLEEYNGKFMCNQFVLRGGCVATPPGHSRASYRNFYEPHQRWMFSGLRLAEDV